MFFPTAFSASDAIRLKVSRAETHFETLKAEIAKYEESRPYQVNVTRRQDGWDLKSSCKSPPPLLLAALVGDCILNLRASLDYIAWALAQQHAGRALDDERDRTQFPICSSAEKFAKVMRGRDSLARFEVPASTIDVIESVQPYQGREAFVPLGHLRDLSNHDKHRSPLIGATVIPKLGSTLLGIEGDVTSNIGVIGATFTELPQEDVEASTYCEGFVSLEHFGGAVDFQIERILTTVRDTVIPKFMLLIR